MTRVRLPDVFHLAVRQWFGTAFAGPTPPQAEGWPAIARGESTLIVAPTGSGKTLAAFLWAIQRVMFAPRPESSRRCRVLYVSPLKALAVDVERNLRGPLAGIGAVAAARGDSFVVPEVAIRTGDTPAADRARFLRAPSDILITTPESLFLLLTSRSRAALTAIETVIVDEIHAVVPTKRGAHLAVSMERLERLCGRQLQRIGLSATQRPLEEVAEFLGGAWPATPARASTRGRSRQETRRRKAERQTRLGALDITDELGPPPSRVLPPPGYRPVTIVDSRQPRPLRLSVEVPVEDMTRLEPPAPAGGDARSAPPSRPSIWSSVHPRLLQLAREHRSTLIFVNNRRLAERLAGALNDLAGEPIARAHHGSIAREQRLDIEEALKRGELRALVATSSLELGIDMGAVDLVIQIEAPPSVASGLQRIGRAGHQVEAVSEGVIFPKFRGDLIACAAVTAAMRAGRVEATHYPRNPLDVLAQQIVAMAATEQWAVDDLFAVVRSAAPFARLSRRVFEGVLDMLSGRYPSDEFAELRPRIVWDRVGETIRGREGSIRMVIANAGTIPDRGLYGVFLAGAPPGSGRVGELDEEMVFESRVGETFVLGASTWRIEEIAHDRVLVSPAPGEPGKMPFWRGDRAGRPVELGAAMGRLVRELRTLPGPAAIERLTRQHDLDRRAAENLVQYLADQAAATGLVPDDRTIVVERCRDELGDWRVCLLSPFGARVHAPWAIAAVARIRDETGLDVETMWTDDGFVMRFPDTDHPPDTSLMLPPVDALEPLLMRQLGSIALFAGRFREIAARSLLLPRRRPGRRAPLWQQRKRASDLLAVASRFGSFPAVLETYRECLRDDFDLPALAGLLRRIKERTIKVRTVDSASPSPFAASLLFGYVANYLYDGDAPLPERRAQALAVDQDQLRDLLGEAEFRELLDAEVIDDLERELQHLGERRRAGSVDGIHDLLLRLGDLSRDELRSRSAVADLDAAIELLVGQRRVLILTVGGEERLVAVEDAPRFRDGIGARLPPGIPASLLEPVMDAAGDLALRYSRTHGPFSTEALAQRLGLALPSASAALERLAHDGRLVTGEFRPGGHGREWCDADVLRQIRHRTLARLRREVEPVSPQALARFLVAWQGVTGPRAGLEALLDVVEQLQGAPVLVSEMERDVLPARIGDFDSTALDTLMAAGEVVWVGLERVGERDGRIALFLTDHLAELRPPLGRSEPTEPRQLAIVEHLRRHGASFFGAIHTASGGGFPGETVEALWELVWAGHLTNDSLHALRELARPAAPRSRRDTRRPFRSRRLAPPTSEGRWGLVDALIGRPCSATEWAAAAARQLLARYGVVTREVVAAEALPGGFGPVYQVLRAMEEAGKVRRGYFVAGLGAAQFASPAALDLLRSFREPPDTPQTVTLAATDPANPFGLILRWPRVVDDGSDPSGTIDRRGPTRMAGATIVLVDGWLAAYLGRGDRQLQTWLPDQEPDRSRVSREVAAAMARTTTTPGGVWQGLLLAEIDGRPAPDHPLAASLEQAGFARRIGGLQAMRPRTPDAGSAAE